MLPSSGRCRYYTPFSKLVCPHGYWPKFETKQVWQSEVTPTKYRMVSCGDWKNDCNALLPFGVNVLGTQRPEGPAVVTDSSLREVQLHQGILDLRVVDWLKCFRFVSVHALQGWEKGAIQGPSHIPSNHLPHHLYPHPSIHSWLLVIKLSLHKGCLPSSLPLAKIP